MSLGENRNFSVGNATGWPKAVIVHTDGASRGNPGPASIGITVTTADGETVYEYAEMLGDQTNNFAEYMAVKRALSLAVSNSVQALTLRSDSQLLIRQLIGEYKVKAEGLKPLYLECLEMSRKIPKMSFEHVRREENKRADQLANWVLDGRRP